MKVHYLQHVAFENLGCLESMLTSKGHTISCTRLFAGETLPAADSFDWLIIMGGPMGIFDETEHPWLAHEKHFIKSAIDNGRTVLGICLGAQLLAHVLGARVHPNEHREIGWFDINPAANLQHPALSTVFGKPMTAFHWHGDTFDIPEGASRLCGSEACHNQGFIFDDRVVALQFHLESTPESATALIENCAQELDGSKWVQSEGEILASPDKFKKLNLQASALIQAMGA